MTTGSWESRLTSIWQVMCHELHFTSQWDGWVLSIHLHTHWKDYRGIEWKWGGWADLYLCTWCRLQPGQFISAGRKDMTTCSKYLEGCVTQGGVLGAEGQNSGRDKKEGGLGRWTAWRAFYTEKGFLHDRVKVQPGDRGSERGNPHTPVLYRRKCYTGAKHHNRCHCLSSS